jgi:hypothetical protein
MEEAPAELLLHFTRHPPSAGVGLPHSYQPISPSTSAQLLFLPMLWLAKGEMASMMTAH